MEIVHADRMEWGGSLTSHRAGHMTHKILFQGEEGSPDNYLFVLANERSDYYSPRHRHAWDQVRFCLEGSVPIGRDLKVGAGELGYFPEGVHYGPQEGGPDRIVLLLQVGGASRLGYLSPEQLQHGRERLLREGIFEEGVFKRRSGAGPKNEDGYEAIWRAVTGRPLSYPKPRYRAPVIMRPDGFAWRDVPATPGVRRKRLGTFPERDLSLELVAVEPGCAYAEPASPRRCLIFVREGQGACGGEPFGRHSAIRLQPGESASFAASNATELLTIGVPLIFATP
ncbi:MAG TPA: hypothetical protein VMD03_05555 [Steroidobacteraceae bacterium]|nr:hypothetical protein [Steroidobacteraceae bacterium]